MPKDFTVRWFDAESVSARYPNTRFLNALSAQANPDRPDMIAVAACAGETIAALAGASADTPDFWQVGIDVLPEYRGRGLGKTPFYGTGASNLHSQRIAVQSGFYPAWVEISSRRLSE